MSFTVALMKATTLNTTVSDLRCGSFLGDLLNSNVGAFIDVEDADEETR